MLDLIRRAGILTGATAATLALSTGAAFAHECYIVNQSDKAQSGTRSQVWFELDLVGSLVADGLWTEEQGDCVNEAAEEAGVQTVVNLLGKVPAPHDGVLGSKNPHAEVKAGDGKGIDHFFSGGAVAPLIGIAIECGAPIPAD